MEYKMVVGRGGARGQKPAGKPEYYSVCCHFRHRGTLYRLGQVRGKEKLFYLDGLHEIDYISKLDELLRASDTFTKVLRMTSPVAEIRELYERELMLCMGWRHMVIHATDMDDAWRQCEELLGKIVGCEPYASHGPMIEVGAMRGEES